MNGRHATRLRCSAPTSPTGRTVGPLSWRAVCADCPWESEPHPVGDGAADEAHWDGVTHEIAPAGADAVAEVADAWRAAR